MLRFVTFLSIGNRYYNAYGTRILHVHGTAELRFKYTKRDKYDHTTCASNSLILWSGSTTSCKTCSDSSVRFNLYKLYAFSNAKPLGDTQIIIAWIIAIWKSIKVENRSTCILLFVYIIGNLMHGNFLKLYNMIGYMKLENNVK